MFNIRDLINSLNKASTLSISLGKDEYVSISISLPTDDLDISYCLSNCGKGFILHWEDMNMINEDITFTKEVFSLLYIEVLKELMKRSGV